MAINSTNPVFKRIESEVDAKYIDEPHIRTATFTGVLLKTGILFLIALLAGGLFVFLAGKLITESTTNGALLSAVVATVIIAPLIALVTCLVGTFSVKASPVCSVLYAAFEGIFLGTFCALLEMVFSGIFLVAMSALFIIFGVTLVLYLVKAVRVTKKFYRFLMIASVAAVLVALTTFIFSMIPGLAIFSNSGFMWILVAVDLFMVFYGTLMLITDFDRASRIQEMQAPKNYEWQVSLGMMVTIVWIFVYILRILVRILALVARRK